MNFGISLEEAYRINANDIVNEEQALEAFQRLFYAGEDAGVLNEADPEFEVAGSDELPNVLAASAFNADQVGNSDGSHIFNTMREIVIKFPNVEYVA